MMGMGEASEPTREQLFAALGQESSPRLDTIMRVMKSLGLRLVVEPIDKPDDAAISNAAPEEPA
jgi:DNA-binding phage protein